MVLNYIWIVFFIAAFVIAFVRLVFMGDVDVFPAIINSTFDTARTAFEMILILITLQMASMICWLCIFQNCLISYVNMNCMNNSLMILLISW